MRWLETLWKQAGVLTLPGTMFYLIMVLYLRIAFANVDRALG
jgi:aspartate/methionine/tyrosine aminotransferase